VEKGDGKAGPGGGHSKNTDAGGNESRTLDGGPNAVVDVLWEGHKRDAFPAQEREKGKCNSGQFVKMKPRKSNRLASRHLKDSRQT